MLDQQVIGLDDLSTGSLASIDRIESSVSPAQWSRFNFVRGDICNHDLCQRLCSSANYVLHHAALASVPESIEDPIEANRVNVDGFLSMLVAARDRGVKRFIFASSSAVYGDHRAVPTAENMDCAPMSPYAVAKKSNELYATAFASLYNVQSIALRYFNCYGGRQRQTGPYASVLSIWPQRILDNVPIVIYGDGESTRDYVHIKDVIQANILASVQEMEGSSMVFNIGSGVQTSLHDLYICLKKSAEDLGVPYSHEPEIGRERLGDIRNSCADTTAAIQKLGYSPRVTLEHGVREMLEQLTAENADAECCK